MDDLLVFDRVDLFATRARTSTHLIIDAGPQPMGEFGINTGPDGKKPADQLQGFSEGGGRRIGTEIERTIFLNPPHDT